VIPPLRVKKKLNQLVGNYEIYKGIESIEVQKKAGMLHIYSKTPFANTVQPLIPEDSGLESIKFYIYMDGLKTPVEFDVKENGEIDLYIERYVYHKK
jgi:hypothetical protein